MNQTKTIKQSQSSVQQGSRSKLGMRKPYHKPTLQSYGELRDITLGGSPGVGDSINPTMELP
jgi:hypothetical protein